MNFEVSPYSLRQQVSFFNCMFYQLLRVQHSCSSTHSWGSVLPSIVETRDQNSRVFGEHNSPDIKISLIYLDSMPSSQLPALVHR